MLIQNLRITFKTIRKVFPLIWLSLILWQCFSVPLRAQVQGAGLSGLSASFIKHEIVQKNGELSFNVARITNRTDNPVRIRPFLELPQGWAMFSTSFIDTIVPAHDSISLAFRIRIPEKVSSDEKHEIVFRAFSPENVTLAAASFFVKPETYHNWNVTAPASRIFFLPRTTQATFDLKLENNGNTREVINLKVSPDLRLSFEAADDWIAGREVSLLPYHDTLVTFTVNYTANEERIFDIGKVQVNASGPDKTIFRAVLVEKYSDTYAPLMIDRSLPHQTEVGFRTFKGNTSLLPFIKARGSTVINKYSSFKYNFTFYDITETEDYIGNTYYSFLYNWKTLNVGLGAFSSELGRNLFSRNAVVVSNKVKLSPIFSMEAFVSQSIFTPKTSVAIGYGFTGKKLGLNGSFAYDYDRDRGINTTSIVARSGNLHLNENHFVMLNLYGYKETHDLKYDYTLTGYAWDIGYYANFGKHFMLQLSNTYGSPNIPGPQMGLLTFSAYTRFYLSNTKRFFSAQYINGRRDYYTYNFEGIKLPTVYLKDQYFNILFHSHTNANHTWQAGPSAEFYASRRPSNTHPGEYNEYRSQNVHFEYKSVLWQHLMVDLKAGFGDIFYTEDEEYHDQRLDAHLVADYSFGHGIGMSLRYDIGPMVNSGLYQFAGDARNHSINIGPTLFSNYFKDRLNVNVSTNLIYRIDLAYLSLGINPKVETYLVRDWYLVVSGTYSFTQQQYMTRQMNNSHYYLEFSIKKRWGKSEIDKWQKDTRKLKIILFKDENGNSMKDYGEQGVPYVKTRLRLTNAPNSDIDKYFPVDITLLSNEEGVVSYNQLPVGFYDLVISPLGDVKEYFYVERGAEKLELTNTSVFYIPFQKATKITGRINVQRAKFIKEGEEVIDLTNIKVTAYNNQGNSYSSFTLQDGSFTIFVPGNNTYFVRLPNVFGSNFKILKNDIILPVSDTTSNRIMFDVVETSRQIAFKKAEAAPADTAQARPLKIKVLHGKIYENPALDTVDVNAVPEFHIQFAPPNEQKLVAGNYYVVLNEPAEREDALKYHRIMEENGLNVYLGYDEKSGKYYVFTNYYSSEDAAKKEMNKLKMAGMRTVRVLKY
jgi:hypothetical protein